MIRSLFLLYIICCFSQIDMPLDKHRECIQYLKLNQSRFHLLLCVNYISLQQQVERLKGHFDDLLN